MAERDGKEEGIHRHSWCVACLHVRTHCILGLTYMQSFLADEEPGIANDPYYNESSWTDTEELTKNSGEPSTQETVVFRNSDFEDVSLGDESLELANHSGWQRTKVTQNTTSQF